MHPIKWEDEKASKISRDYVIALGDISDGILASNDGRSVMDTYTVLDPKNIPLSTGI